MDELHASLSKCTAEGSAPDWEACVPLLEQVQQAMKSQAAREALAGSPLMDDIVHVLAAFGDTLPLEGSVAPGAPVQAATLAFRALRNACVEAPGTQLAIAAHVSLAKTTARILCSLSSLEVEKGAAGSGKSADSPLACMRSGAQLLGNTVAGNEAAKASLWPHIFPRVFSALLGIADAAVFTATTMLLYNCILDSDVRMTDFAAMAPGWDVARRLLLAMEGWLEGSAVRPHGPPSAGGADLSWSFFIIEAVMSAGKLTELYHGLETPLAEQSLRSPELVASHIGACQQAKLVLLKLLEGFALDTKDGEDHSVLAMNTVKLLGERFRLLGYLAEERDWWGAEESLFPSLTLVMVTSILAKASAQSVLEVRTYLGKCGVLEKCIVLLRSTRQWLLEDDLLRRAQREAAGAASAAPLRQPFSDIPHTRGFSRDLMAIVGNLAFEHKENQDLTREFEGIQAILSHMAIDDHNPYIKEWAVVALKHLCKGNAENQQVLASIEQRPHDVVTSKELDEMGLEIELDPQTGRPRVKQRAKEEAAQPKREEDFL